MTTKSVDTAHLRSVVLAGHAGAGKTTLAEALLYRTGAISRQGRVEDGTTTLDFEPEEQKRHMSLSLAVGSLDDEGNLVSIIDTPGYPDFAAEVVSPKDRSERVQQKIMDYKDAKVRLIWVISPETRTVLIRRLDGTCAEVGEAGELSGEDVIPGFTCKVADLFA